MKLIFKRSIKMKNIVNKEIEKVRFLGDRLTSIKDTRTGKIYAVIREICYNLGFGNVRKNNQIRKINRDSILKDSVSKMILNAKNGIRTFYCIDIDYLPIWLVKINPKTIKDKHSKDKLIKYQLKAKDVLSEVFLRKNNKNLIEQYTVTKLENRINLLEQNIKLNKKKIEIHDSFFKDDNDKLISVNDFSKLTYPTFGMGRNQLYGFLREHKILMNGVNRNIPYQGFIRNNWFVVKEVVKDNIGIFKTFIQAFITPIGVEKLYHYISEKTI